MTGAEKWLSVVGWEDLYEVSDEGRVRRHRGGRGTIAGKVLKLRVLPNGYAFVSLCRGGMPRNAYVHRLVAAAFLGAPPDGHITNHIDADKRNNVPSNLEYVTPQGNTQHARRLGLLAKGEDHGIAVLTEAEVREIRSLAPFHTQVTLAERFGVSKSTIGLIVHGRTWQHVV